MSLTEEQKKDYVASEGQFCPYCGTEMSNIDYGDISISGIYCHQKATCGRCEKEWEDVFVLDTINEKGD